MMDYIIYILALLAMLLEVLWRARAVDENGTLQMSMREESVLDNFHRVKERYENNRHKRPF